MLALQEERRRARSLMGRMRRSLLTEVTSLQHDLQVATQKEPTRRR
jgi:hypothetical protein